MKLIIKTTMFWETIRIVAYDKNHFTEYSNNKNMSSKQFLQDFQQGYQNMFNEVLLTHHQSACVLSN